MLRLLFVAGVVFWYFVVRNFIYTRFILPNRFGNDDDDFEWWISWFMAIPITGLSIMALIFIVTGIIPWIYAGF